jgi:hypothetical protein
MMVAAVFSGCGDTRQDDLPSVIEAPDSPYNDYVPDSQTLSIQGRTIEIKDMRGDRWLATYADLYHFYYLRASNSWLTVYSWKDSNEINPDSLISYFAAQTNWSQTRYEDIYLPGEFLEPYLMRYFDVDAEHLRKSSRYRSQEGTYRLIDLPHSYMDSITDASMDAGILTISYQTYNYNPDNSVDSVRKEGKLAIEIDSYPLSFRYVSNEVIERNMK